MKILFWNIQKKDLHKAINLLIDDIDIDVAIFAEGKNLKPSSFIKKGYENLKTLSKLSVFSRLSNDILYVIAEGDRFTCLIFESPISGKILIFAIHLISKVNSSASSRVIESRILSEEIVRIKKEYEIDHIVICGDFNQNPYEEGVASGGCFNATQDKDIALKMKRVIQGKEYFYFYNPMWKFYGSNSRPHGTYFHRTSDHMAINWNILDQFLISPSLLNLVDDDSFEILFKTDNINLVRMNGNINYKQYSDHLPILMTANI